MAPAKRFRATEQRPLSECRTIRSQPAAHQVIATDRGCSVRTVVYCVLFTRR